MKKCAAETPRQPPGLSLEALASNIRAPTSWPQTSSRSTRLAFHSCTFLVRKQCGQGGDTPLPRSVLVFSSVLYWPLTLSLTLLLMLTLTLLFLFCSEVNE